MDAYQESLNNVENGIRTMVVLIDGFGYHQYTDAMGNGTAPFMASLDDAKKATTVYQPVSHAGLAAMVTGRPPCDNGIYQRGMSDIMVPDIFERMTQMGKTSVYIEGHISLINTSLAAELNADRDGDEMTDDEVFETAMDAVTSDADFLFVHFHGVDDLGHDNGDLSASTMDKISEVDGYIKALAENFKGRLIISADHGMHTTTDGGSHGEFRYEDMIVPYISAKIE
jgi:predicted AlkP superfamily pyrophosphatase or phosphodiesterase